jgi:hypothetical protein
MLVRWLPRELSSAGDERRGQRRAPQPQDAPGINVPERVTQQPKGALFTQVTMLHNGSIHRIKPLPTITGVHGDRSRRPADPSREKINIESLFLRWELPGGHWASLVQSQYR